MVFDPVKMKWLKAARHSTDPRSPSEFDEDEEDPFAGIEDFKDNESIAGRSHAAGDVGSPDLNDPTFVGEEFDVGPGFIRRQREEEAAWRRRVFETAANIEADGDGRSASSPLPALEHQTTDAHTRTHTLVPYLSSLYTALTRTLLPSISSLCL
jgi:hypothetical protein